MLERSGFIKPSNSCMFVRMIRFLFKQPQPRRFQYRPRHFDETKQYLEAREKTIKREIELEKEGYSAEGFRSQLNHQWRSKQNRKESATSNRNVLIIVALLAAVAYYFLFT
jgi:hypothetical protein